MGGDGAGTADAGTADEGPANTAAGTALTTSAGCGSTGVAAISALEGAAPDCSSAAAGGGASGPRIAGSAGDVADGTLIDLDADIAPCRKEAASATSGRGAAFESRASAA